MTHASVTIILHEHRALSAMLRAILLLLGEHRRRGTLPHFGALRAMLFYVDEFPEKLHHPKESRLRFPKLRGHNAHSDGALDRLCRDHERGEHAIRGLEHALLGFELMGETNQQKPRRATFETAMTLYVRFYLEHMHIEEAQVLPLAEAMLGAGDWAELDDAFLENQDPLTVLTPSRPTSRCSRRFWVCCPVRAVSARPLRHSRAPVRRSTRDGGRRLPPACRAPGPAVDESCISGRSAVVPAPDQAVQDAIHMRPLWRIRHVSWTAP